MKAKYIRVSTVEQNPGRQEDKKLKNYIDKCSGTIPFKERPEARKLIEDVLDGKINYIVVHSISRLGRSTIDILKTIEFFNGEGVCIEAEKEGFKTLNRDKTQNTTAKMVISIMATLSEFEYEMRAERTKEGIARAKAQGKYAANGGRPVESQDKFLMKDKNRKILRLLQKSGSSLRDIAYRTKSSLGTVQKVKKVAIELGMLDKDNTLSNEDKLRRAVKDL